MKQMNFDKIALPGLRQFRKCFGDVAFRNSFLSTQELDQSGYIRFSPRQMDFRTRIDVREEKQISSLDESEFFGRLLINVLEDGFNVFEFPNQIKRFWGSESLNSRAKLGAEQNAEVDELKMGYLPG